MRYHGTDADFGAFDLPLRARHDAYLGKGVYASEDVEDINDLYAGGRFGH